MLKQERNITPRQVLYQDLTTTIKLLQGQRIEVIISGDFNSEATSQSMVHLLNINNNLELISDPEAIQSSYKLAKSCIDHAFASKILADKVNDQLSGVSRKILRRSQTHTYYITTE
jgi:endonuclease/exonuclease/phosphatase (EEP) superfamily protein YafD